MGQDLKIANGEGNELKKVNKWKPTNLKREIVMKLTKLCEPGKIGNLTIRNRMVMPPMGTSFGSMTGGVTDRIIDWYTERAKGGVGLIIVENTLVTPPEKYGQHLTNELLIYHPNCIPGFRLLTDAVHDYGAKIAVQINYPGQGADPFSSAGVQPVTPSPVISPTYIRTVITREATIEEIQYLVNQYGVGAQLAKMAGFDAVEIHCVHGYGVAGFQSQAINRRNDAYGGPFENRMRFGREVISRVRGAVGDDFPVWCRIPLIEWAPGGSDPEECVRIAQVYEAAGVNALSLSVGTMGDVPVPNKYQPRATFEPYLENMRKAVNVPLMVAGSFNNPEDAERVLREGKADFICIGRGLIADPEYPKKVMERRPEDIRKCLRCLDGCLITMIFSSSGVDCAVNIEAGKETRRKMTLAEKPKNVLVVGGGPGGMEAARVAAVRGHDVTLCEKGSELGGALIPGSVASFKVENKWLKEWFSIQLQKLGVKVELGKEVTPELVAKMKPDVVIVATGAVPIIPDIPGVERAAIAVDVLLGKIKVGKEVVVAGGGLVGCETALHLAANGEKVTIIEMLGDMAMDMDSYINKPATLKELTKNNVKWFTRMKLEEVTEKGVTCIDSNWKRKTISADTVVLALGSKPLNGLVQSLKGKVAEVYAIGDCVEPRKLKQAIYEGSLIGRRI